MNWTPGGTSSDIEDRRGETGGGGGGFGFGGGGGGLGGMHLGIGGTIVVLVLSVIFRTDLFSMFGGGSGPMPPSQPSQQVSRQVPSDPSQDREVQFVSFVLDDVQRNWETILPREGKSYRHSKLVLFRDMTQSGCGSAESATGPFYCPADEKVYVDLGFFDELKTKFGAPGEFAQAYVLAHEVGHHVQKILGIEGKVQQAMQENRSVRNQLSVRLELQADCFAGVWGNSTEQRKIIDQGDVEAGMKAAASVGDDRLQRMSRGTVNPESFTHGSSAQRTEWFKKGLDSGKLSACNTFSGL